MPTDAELAKTGPLTLHSKWLWDTSAGDEVCMCSLCCQLRRDWWERTHGDHHSTAP
jgi:hypothetical protein